MTATAMPIAMPAVSRWRLLLAFAAVYFIWGSTYLAIKTLVTALPPFLMAGLRSTTAGGLLFAWALARGTPPPNRREWQYGTLAGALMFLVGHGALFWGSQHIASGLAAILVATIPVWVAALVTVRGRIPTPQTVAGLIVGLLGVAWLNLPGKGAHINVVASAVILTGAASWALAMVWYRGDRRPASSILAAAVPLIAGGGLLLAVSAVVEHPTDVSRDAVTAVTIGCFAYVVVFGSIVAFTSFAWLVNVASPTAVSSYAFVNPVVALTLGWSLGHERFGLMTLLPAIMVLSSVILILLGEPSTPSPITSARPNQ